MLVRFGPVEPDVHLIDLRRFRIGVYYLGTGGNVVAHTPECGAVFATNRILCSGIVGGTLDVVLRIVSYAHSPDADTRIFIGPLIAVLVLEAVLLIRISRNKGK
jgi:hypothetical protein